MSDNVERRVAQHNSGKERTTRAYAPFECIHVEEFETRMQARQREKYLKSGLGKEWLKGKYSL
jgi:putative endonuclease